jgi:hypothetical protein
MKVQFRGKFFYFTSGPEFANEIQAEEWVGFWRNIDETKRTEMINTACVVSVDVFPDLYEVHLYMDGRKIPRQYKMATVEGYNQVIQTLQSGLSFDTN